LRLKSNSGYHQV